MRFARVRPARAPDSGERAHGRVSGLMHASVKVLGIGVLLSTALLSVMCGGDSPSPSTPTPAPPPAPTPPPAPPEPPRFAWPVAGDRGVDWVIHNYVDLQPGLGLLDYQGGARTYDGHNGTDMDSPSFRWMDRGAPPVLAAAPGWVTSTHDGESDRNTEAFDRNPFCDGLRNWGNFVEITHEDGSRALYLHLANGSLAVSEDQVVETGQQLGVVGSSGCSTWPHLHFEVRSADDGVVDPFLEEIWTDPPAYDVPLTFMDYSVKNGPISDIAEIADPLPNATSISVGDTLGVGLVVAGGLRTDSFQVTLRDHRGVNSGPAFPRLRVVGISSGTRFRCAVAQRMGRLPV